MAEPLLEIQGLTVQFRTPNATFPAVQDVSLSIARGEILGLVGESGCGKTTTALSALRLLPVNTRVVAGRVLLRENGNTRDLAQLSERKMRRVRGSRMAMVFQEPMTALNPVMRVGDQIAEALLAHREVTRAEARCAALEMMGHVAIPDAERRMKQYPHQLSGGLRQRVLIAMALMCRPLLLIADEPTTALDVTIQAQILALLAELRQRLDLALLLISHDLGVVAQVADRVAVMYAGRIVESGTMREVFATPAHPYTRGLLRAAPSLAAQPQRRMATIEGFPPDLRRLPSGCAFEPRCDLRIAECQQAVPELVEIAQGHRARCIRANEISPAK